MVTMNKKKKRKKKKMTMMMKKKKTTFERKISEYITINDTLSHLKHHRVYSHGAVVRDVLSHACKVQFKHLLRLIRNVARVQLQTVVFGQLCEMQQNKRNARDNGQKTRV